MSKIEWTEKTWNPVIGCSLASPGCARCYAGTMARRQVAMAAGLGKVSPYASVVRIAEPGQKPRTGAAAWNGEVRFLPDRLAEPLRWRKGVRVFVNSMSDLFHEKLSFYDIAAIFGVMASAPQHVFQVLTKRAERMEKFLAWLEANHVDGETRRAVTEEAWGRLEHPRDAQLLHEGPWPLPNVWLGVSVEDEKRADERLPLLAEVRAQGWRTFASVEPLIGPISHGFTNRWQAAEWVVIGGESGPHSRRCEVDWIREIRDDAQAAGAAVFVKQLGAAYEDMLGAVVGASVDAQAAARRWGWPTGYPMRLSSGKGSDMTEWPRDLCVRDMPAGM